MTLPSVVPVFSNGQYQGSYIGGKWRSYRQELESLPVPIGDRFDQTVKELETKVHGDCQGYNYDPCLSDENKELAAVRAMKELDCGVLEQKKRCAIESKNIEILSRVISDVENSRSQHQRNNVLMGAENYCMQIAIQYPSAGQGLCDAAIDQAVGQVSGEPSAYDLCHSGSEAACEIAIEHMSVSDPRYDEVWTRVHRPYEVR
jgi:hypothetical protein